jgi:hypothetical protein
MADVLLLFPPDKKFTARQIADAARSAGYDVTLDELAETEAAGIAPRARGASAALLIWSRALTTSAVTDGWLAAVRQLPNLVEVSTDGIAPETGEAGRVVLLSGWRGQPYHLGWQKILEELKKRQAPRMARAAPASAAPASPPGGKATARGTGIAVRRFALPALGVAALLGAAGAVSLSGSREPEPEAAPRVQAAALVPTVVARAEAPPTGAPSIAAPSAAASPPQARPAALVAPASLRPAAKAGAHERPRPKSAQAVSDGPVKRYSKRHSKTMRLFCARSGRSTPQCRTFLRSTRASRA